MNCPCCRSSKNVKAGFQSEKQRRKCKDCGRLFVKLSPRGFSPEIKAQAVSLYLEGLGFRAIGRLLGVSNVAVLKWIKAAADALPKPIKPAVVDVLELDELWHFPPRGCVAMLKKE